MSRICKRCSHWVNQDWDVFNYECFLEHGPASGVGDGGYTDADDCPDYDGPDNEDKANDDLGSGTTGGDGDDGGGDGDEGGGGGGGEGGGGGGGGGGEGGGGGGGGGDGGGCAVITGVVLAIVIFYYGIRGARYAVETYIIKTVNPSYVTSFENDEKTDRERRDRETQKARVEAKAQEMRILLGKQFANYAMVFIDVLPIDERELFATISPFHMPRPRGAEPSDHIVIRTLDGGSTWQTLLSSSSSLEHLSVKCEQGQRLITVRLLSSAYYKNGILWATSQDEGKTWRYVRETQLGVCPVH